MKLYIENPKISNINTVRTKINISGYKFNKFQYAKLVQRNLLCFYRIISYQKTIKKRISFITELKRKEKNLGKNLK